MKYLLVFLPATLIGCASPVVMRASFGEGPLTEATDYVPIRVAHGESVRGDGLLNPYAQAAQRDTAPPRRPVATPPPARTAPALRTPTPRALADSPLPVSLTQAPPPKTSPPVSRPTVSIAPIAPPPQPPQVDETVSRRDRLRLAYLGDEALVRSQALNRFTLDGVPPLQALWGTNRTRVWRSPARARFPLRVTSSLTPGVLAGIESFSAFAAALKEFPDQSVDVLIATHDDSGDVAAAATAVRQYLAESGLDPSYLRIVPLRGAETGVPPGYLEVRLAAGNPLVKVSSAMAADDFARELRRIQATVRSTAPMLVKIYSSAPTREAADYEMDLLESVLALSPSLNLLVQREHAYQSATPAAYVLLGG